jgi:16S rRNA (cytidine1402-2'-O)-methyltransferase
MSKLYVIPTPIGNLEDITLRAIRILKDVDLILVEDTRNSAKLLKHYQIGTRMQSFHQYNEHKTLQGIVDRIASGEKIALITDAGTPGISDPGFILVRECVRNGLDLECLPGPTAFVPALVNSGLASDKFFFEGFLPHKKGRKSRLEILSQSPYTLILYESPFRLVKTLEQLSEYFGEERQASVSRELTKIYEETKRGSLKDLSEYFNSKKVQGEIVIIVSGKS